MSKRIIYGCEAHGNKNRGNMKLSKAQQEVVDKMREGAFIRYHGVAYKIRLNTGSRIETLNKKTFFLLVDRQVIAPDGSQYPRTYYLTEQYKT